MTDSCPRCGTPSAECQYTANSAGDETLWEVLHCSRCSFTWRSSEEAAVIDRARRPAVFQLDAADPEHG